MGIAETTETVPITPAGYERLRAELEALSTDGRREIAERLREAREAGQLEDNPAVLEVLEEQAQLERKIATLEAQLAAVEIVEPRNDGRVGVGSQVVIRDLETGEVARYEVVGPLEGGSGEGRLSAAAPVGQALLGAAAGETVTVASPRGTIRFLVLDVSVPVDAEDDDGPAPRDPAA